MAVFDSGLMALAVVGHRRPKVRLTTTVMEDVFAAVIAAFGSTQAFFAVRYDLGNHPLTDLVAVGEAFLLPKLVKLQENFTSFLFAT